MHTDQLTAALTGHLTDPKVLGAVLRDLLRFDAATESPGGRGVRPNPEVRPGIRRLNALLGERYQMDPFHEAYRKLTLDDSIRDVAERTGLSSSVVGRIAAGQEPTPEQMAAIATGYSLPAEWFVEYRAHLLSTMVADAVRRNPEGSASVVASIQT